MLHESRSCMPIRMMSVHLNMLEQLSDQRKRTSNSAIGLESRAQSGAIIRWAQAILDGSTTPHAATPMACHASATLTAAQQQHNAGPALLSTKQPKLPQQDSLTSKYKVHCGVGHLHCHGSGGSHHIPHTALRAQQASGGASKKRPQVNGWF